MHQSEMLQQQSVAGSVTSGVVRLPERGVHGRCSLRRCEGHNQAPGRVDDVPASVRITTSCAVIAAGDPAAASGNGIPARSGDGIGGQIGGLLRIRDDLAMTFERQVDDIARGLIAATAERDQSIVPSRPDLAGLFTAVGGVTLPAAPGSMIGLAGLIVVNANADPASGGALSRLRDGGISAPADIAYSYNPTSAPGFGGRLLELIDRLSEAQSFDPATGIATSQKSVRQFSADSVGWLQRERSVAHESHANEAVRVERATSAWQNRVGTNVDDEMVILIGLQRSFQASSHLIATVNSMFDALLRATE